jgi:UDP-N-acetyl-D-galactosamine dehydrogenase
MALDKMLSRLVPGGVFADVKSSYDPAALADKGVRVWRL